MSASPPTDTMGMPSRSAPGFARTLVIISAIAALACILILRITGPSDLWDHTQPKTVSYTTDILVHGRWILPIERGEFPATKPPLYNWIAAPFVWLAGFSSERAHKAPSMLALMACWAVTIVLGWRIDRTHGGLVGWMAGLAVVSTQMFFKLGYLARPDMLLTLWLELGWIAATALMLTAEAKPRRALQLGFWLCVALAGMTKGPAALVLILYALVAGKLLTGSWRSTARIGWLWGLPLALLVNGAWLLAVWRVNPDHLIKELWGAEFIGRVTGTGPKGTEGVGPWYPLVSLTYMPYYFLSRMLPWSVLAILAMVHLWRRNLAGPKRNWMALRSEGGAWYHAAAVFIILVVVIFSISTGKRADYLASTVPPAALLASWWLLRVRADFGRWPHVLAPLAAAIAIVALTMDDRMQPHAPSPTYGNEIRTFIGRFRDAIEAHPLPVVFYHAGESHLQAFLGKSEVDGLGPLQSQLARGEAFWLIQGPLPIDDPPVAEVIKRSARKYDLKSAVVCEPSKVAATWPGQMTLWLVTPVPAR